ncbi:MAG: hypothetical protein ACE1ZC_02660, partial [Nitrososphaerales archaeon]
ITDRAISLFIFTNMIVHKDRTRVYKASRVLLSRSCAQDSISGLRKRTVSEIRVPSSLYGFRYRFF